MFKHTASYILFGIGMAGLVFSLVRTYLSFRRLKREREAKGRFQEKISRRPKD